MFEMVDTRKKNTNYVIDFYNGRFLIEPHIFKGFTVKLARTSCVGDWKTASAHNRPLSYDKDTIGVCTRIWDNYEGRWATVVIGDRSVDLRPTDLECLVEFDTKEIMYLVVDDNTIIYTEISPNTIRQMPIEKSSKYFKTFDEAKTSILNELQEKVISLQNSITKITDLKPPHIPKKFSIETIDHLGYRIRLTEFIFLDMDIYELCTYLKIELRASRYDFINGYYAVIRYNDVDIVFEYHEHLKNSCMVKVSEGDLDTLLEFIYDYRLHDNMRKDNRYITIQKRYLENPT